MARHKSIWFLACILLTAGIALAQPSYPVDPPRGAIVPNSPARNERNLERRMTDMRTLESRMRVANERDKASPGRPRLTPGMIEEIKKRRRIEPGIIQSFSKFLKSDNTGIFKLFPDLGCITANIVRVDGECGNFVPESSGYSFRNDGYSDLMFHDLYYTRGEIRSFDFFAQGIFVELGEVPIESVVQSDPAVTALNGFIAEVTPEEAIRNAKNLSAGVTLGGLSAKDHILPKEGTTYLLRHIAYRLANSVPPPGRESTFLQLKFLSLDLDNRDDTVIVFRIVDLTEEGAATIVWKQLMKTKAPKLKFAKGEPLSDLREERKTN